MKSLRHNARGVTLLELLVVVAIIGILTLLSVPNIPAIIAGHRLRTSANDLMSKLRTVRSLAISKGRPLAVAFTFDNSGKEYYFQVKKDAYIEYNLLSKQNEQDFNTNFSRLTDAELQEIEDDLNDGNDEIADKYKPFILFAEKAEDLHITPLWKNDGTPEYKVPINYELERADTGTHGIECMTVNTAVGGGCDPASAATSFTMRVQPSGVLEPNGVFVLQGPDKYGPGRYEIMIYKGGQIRIREHRS